MVRFDSNRKTVKDSYESKGPFYPQIFCVLSVKRVRGITRVSQIESVRTQINSKDVLEIKPALGT